MYEWSILAVKSNQCLTTVLKDRAERAARFAKTKEEVEAAKAAALLAKQAEMEVKRDSSARERRYFISCLTVFVYVAAEKNTGCGLLFDADECCGYNTQFQEDTLTSLAAANGICY